MIAKVKFSWYLWRHGVPGWHCVSRIFRRTSYASAYSTLAYLKWDDE